MVKNKVAPPFRTAEFELMFDGGISKEGDAIILGLEDKIIDKKGNWLYYNEVGLGNGSEKAKEYLRENPAVMEELTQPHPRQARPAQAARRRRGRGRGDARGAGRPGPRARPDRPQEPGGGGVGERGGGVIRPAGRAGSVSDGWIHFIRRSRFQARRFPAPAALAPETRSRVYADRGASLTPRRGWISYTRTFAPSAPRLDRNRRPCRNDLFAYSSGASPSWG